MALGLGTAPANVTGTTTALTSASFTPNAGDLLILLYACNGTGDTSITSVTNTGTATTWTRRARKNTNASSTGGASSVAGGAEIWTATAPGGAITVTANGVGSGVGFEKQMQLQVVTGANLSLLTNVVGFTVANGTVSSSITATQGSYVFAASSDARARGAATVGTGQTLISEFTTGVGTHVWRTTSTLAATGSQTMNMTAPTGQDADMVLLEVVPGAPVRPRSVIKVANFRASSY